MRQENLKDWRSRLGWTQATAARELCIEVGSLKNIEHGRKSASATLLRLAELIELHVTVLPQANVTTGSKPASKPAPARKRTSALMMPVERRAANVMVAAHQESASLAECEPAPVEHEQTNAEIPVDHDLQDIFNFAFGFGGASTVVAEEPQSEPTLTVEVEAEDADDYDTPLDPDLQDALELADVPEAAWHLVAAEVERLRWATPDSRTEGARSKRELADEEAQREDDWQAVAGPGARPFNLIVGLIASTLAI